MNPIGRPGLSAAQKKDLWQRWKVGQSLSEIARALGKHPGSIHGVVKANGGIVPAPKTRAPRSLTSTEREEISRGLAQGESMRMIATRLCRAPSTVSREIERHGGRLKYRAARADARAWLNAQRPKPCLLSTNLELRDAVAQKLADDWSPQQISGWLRGAYIDDDAMRVSAETIYRSLFLQARGVLDKQLVSHLRRVRTMRSSRHASTEGQGRGGIIGAVSIRDRPAEVADRLVHGHWEGDLITGSHNSHIATLVERHSRFVMLVKVAGKDTDSVVDAMINQVGDLPIPLMTTLTWDRGTELAAHARFTRATNVKVFFADAKSPWQRGTNENTNGLLRQYFPSGTDLSVHTQPLLNNIASKMNHRPRKTLGYITPAAKLHYAVAMTG
jgi:IS30 family transposase